MYAALLRGINVGRAKRLPMQDLRDLLEDLGFQQVKTLLNSGNAVFDARRRDPKALAASIEAAVAERMGFSSATVVVGLDRLAAIVQEAPTMVRTADPSRCLVAFVQDRATLKAMAALGADGAGSERLDIGAEAAYLCCPDGLAKSVLAEKVFGVGGVTTRNWATTQKLLALMRPA